jgi:hypothetical protein
MFDLTLQGERFDHLLCIWLTSVKCKHWNCRYQKQHAFQSCASAQNHKSIIDPSDARARNKYHK